MTLYYRYGARRYGSRRKRTVRAAIGSIKLDVDTGLLYIYEFHPITESLEWLRYDTFVRGQLLRFPYAVADPRRLAPVSRATLLRTRRYL